MLIKTLSAFLLLIYTGAADFAFAQTYFVYVAAESDDEISLISYDAVSGGAQIEQNIEVGEFPTETEGPHGMRVGPDDGHWYFTLAHGIPYGYMYKYKAGTNEKVGRVELGMFPATFDYSPVTGWFYVVNFDLHGDHVPSTVSVVDPVEMVEIDQVETGVMPHGARISPDGMRMYHASMMTDEVIVLNTVSLEIEKRISLTDKTDGHHSMGHHSTAMASSDDHNMESVKHNPEVKPTWVDPHPSKPFIYVAGNGNNKIYEYSTETWEKTREWDTDKGPYNLEVTPDGNLLVVSYKGAGRTGIWDLNSGEELANLENSRKVTHGVVTTPDSKYAFMSVEGIGGEPGSVEVVDLEKKEIVAVVETGKQAGGITFWKMEN